jgi:hypothetical protein
MAALSDADRTHERLLDEAEYRLQELYRTLTDLAESLAPPEPTPTDTMDQMDYRLGLSGIHRHVLSARHELHGSLTEVILARSQFMRYRRPPPP